MFPSTTEKAELDTNWSGYSCCERREGKWNCSGGLSSRYNWNEFGLNHEKNICPHTKKRESTWSVSLEHAEISMCYVLLRLNMMGIDCHCNESLINFREGVTYIPHFVIGYKSIKEVHLYFERHIREIVKQDGFKLERCISSSGPFADLCAKDLIRFLK